MRSRVFQVANRHQPRVSWELSTCPASLGRKLERISEHHAGVAKPVPRTYAYLKSPAELRG